MARAGFFRPMRRVLFSAVLFAAASAGPPAIAAQVMLKQESQPTVYHPAGHRIDVLGITPGMSPDAVKPILEKEFGHADVVQENMGLEFRGVAVATQNYITRMSAQKGGDSIQIWFATPTTGNGVVEVTRQTTYFNAAEAPLLSQVRQDLTGQYGPPAFEGPAVGTGEIQLLAWSYKGDQPSSCKLSSCRADFDDGLSVADMANYQRAVRRGHELTIIGMLLAGIDDPNHASSVVTTVSDAATKLRTLDTAIKQMQESATEKPEAPAKPASRPGR